MPQLSSFCGIIHIRKFSTTTPSCVAKTFVTPQFSRISPRRVNVLEKSKQFNWQEKYRKFALQQAQVKPIQCDRVTIDINSKEVYKVESILPEMEIFYNVHYDYFAVVHGPKKKVTLDQTKAVINDAATRREAVKNNSFVIDSETKTKINYLQRHDPNCIWTPAALSTQFEIPEEAILQQTPPTEKQNEAMRYYKIFQSKLSTIDRSQHKVYLEKKRYIAIEQMKVALDNYDSDDDDACGSTAVDN